MLYYNITDISKGIDPPKSSNVKNVCFAIIVFYRWFKFQGSICNGCHDLTMVGIRLNDISIVTVKNVDYHWIIHDISKSEAIYSLENSVPEDREYL